MDVWHIDTSGTDPGMKSLSLCARPGGPDVRTLGKLLGLHELLGGDATSPVGPCRHRHIQNDVGGRIEGTELAQFGVRQQTESEVNVGVAIELGDSQVNLDVFGFIDLDQQGFPGIETHVGGRVVPSDRLIGT